MIVVTGGHGFIGSHVVNKLIEKKYNVVVIDIKENPSFPIKGKYTFIKEDITTSEKIKDIIINSDGVIHLAALVNVEKCAINSKRAFEINTVATYRLYTYAKEKPFIFSSSASVYGNKEICREGDCPNPLNIYGISKLSAEYLINGTILRYFNVYGEGQHYSTKAVIPSFFHSILSKGQVTIYGDGNQTRDFIYVEDVAKATLKAFEMNVKGIFNIGTGIPTSLLQLLYKIKLITKKEVNIDFKPMRNGDIRKSVADITKAKNLLNFNPKTSLEEGLTKTYKWIKSSFF